MADWKIKASSNIEYLHLLAGDIRIDMCRARTWIKEFTKANAIRRARLQKEKIGPRPLGKLFLGGRRRLVSIPLPTSLLATLIEKNPTTANLPRCKV